MGAWDDLEAEGYLVFIVWLISQKPHYILQKRDSGVFTLPNPFILTLFDNRL
jgi:hypothetical protein